MAIRVLVRRISELFRKDQLDREFGEEIESNLQLQIADNMRSGMDADEARRQAHLKLGGVEQTRQAYRDRRGLPSVESFGQDIRHGFRMLCKRPAFTAIAVLTLALGVGANTAVFSAVYAVLLRPLPYPQSQNVVTLFGANARLHVDSNPVSYPNFADWRAQAQSFSELAAYSEWGFNIGGERPQRLHGVIASTSFLDVFRVPALLGSASLSNDRSATPGVVISYGFWQSYFGGDSAIVGRQAVLNRQPATIIGVMPQYFAFPADAQLWTSLVQIGDPKTMTNRGSNWLRVVGRLKSGVTLRQSQAEADRIAERLGRAFPNEAGWSIRVAPLHESLTGEARPALLILLGGVVLVLLIACANLSNMMLARGASRNGEFALRLALGASRNRLLRQLLTESLLLSVLGCMAGIVLAWVTLGTVRAAAAQFLPAGFPIRLDATVLGFAGVLSIAAAILFGSLPALHACGAGLAARLRQTAPALHGSGNWIRAALVGAEVALSLMLLIGGGLLLKGFMRLRAVDPGFQPDHLLTFSTSRMQAGSSAAAGDFFSALLDRLSMLPNVSSAGATTTLPESGDAIQSTFWLPENGAEPDRAPQAAYDAVSPEYFPTMKVPLLEGRQFMASDRQGSQPVMIVNREFARRFFASQDPIGKTVAVGMSAAGNTAPRVVVGVVGNLRHDRLDAPAEPTMYVPMAQEQWPFTWFVVRTGAPTKVILDEIRHEVAQLDPQQPVSGVHAMQEILDASIADRRFTSLLMAAFAALALILAIVGIYAVIAYAVSLRTREIGIRIALGGSPSQIARLVVQQGAIMTAGGIVAGIALSLVFTRVLKTLLFSISTLDAHTFIEVTAIVIAVALLASYIPARRAAKVDPMVSLRFE